MTSSLPPLNSGALLSPLPAADSPANTYTDVNGLAALKRDPNSEESIKAVAQQVEAMFLQMMLKSMRDANMGDGTSGTDSNEMSMYQDMFDKQIALTMSQHEDLGIAALLRRQTGGKVTPAGAKGVLGSGVTSSATAGASLGGVGGAAEVESEGPTPAEFVSQVMPAIERAAADLGVDARGLLAQAALETGWGQRMPRMADGSPSHNLFGIKANDEWTGARATADTMEFANGVMTPRRSAFRAYGSVDESIADFARLLKNSPRYRDVIAAGGDTDAYVESLGKSGYATDPQYANKLNRILNSGALRAALIPPTVKL
jgi:peptidoglycan hydrolase FlgJ